jgi:hypothetical protein
MNHGLKWKLIAVFLLVFIAGGMAGGFIGVAHAHHRFFERTPTKLNERMRRHLRVQLRLNHEQLAKISPIIDKTAVQLGEIQRTTSERVRDTIAQEHREMSAYLTEEQRARLKQLEARPRRWPLFHGPRRSPAQPREPRPATPEATITAFSPPITR